MRILIIDDEAMQRELLGGFLEKKGYDVAMAADGAEAMKRFAEAPYPLVLLDHKMPDMTGDEVLAGMKALNPFVHAIMITAHGSVDTAVAVMKLGADDFLEKPVDLVELLEKIRMIESRVAIEADAAEVNDVHERFGASHPDYRKQPGHERGALPGSAGGADAVDGTHKGGRPVRERNLSHGSFTC